MLKFFRKIRQNLLSEGKTGHYLKYAIGEIILVVIGILIALSINNWNEERKNDQQIQLLLNNLITSLEEDISYLNTTATLHEFRSNSLYRLLKIARNNEEPFSLVQLIPKLENNNFWEGPYPDTVNTDFVNLTIIYSGIHDDVVINKDVLDELKSTGLFSSLNESLKESVNDYYSFVNSNFLIDDWNKDLSISWRNFLRDEYEVLTMELYFRDSPYDFVKENEPVQIRIHEMIGPARFRSDNASQAIKLAEEVLNKIDEHQNEI